MGKHNRKRTHREIHIGKMKSGVYKLKIQIGKYKSDNTNENIQVGKIQIGRTVGKVQISAIYAIATLLIRTRGGSLGAYTYRPPMAGGQ